MTADDAPGYLLAQAFEGGGSSWSRVLARAGRHMLQRRHALAAE
jgi:hypothetical protein